MKSTCKCVVQTETIDWNEIWRRLVSFFRKKECLALKILPKNPFDAHCRNVVFLIVQNPIENHWTIKSVHGSAAALRVTYFLSTLECEREKRNMVAKFSENLLQENEHQSNIPIDSEAISCAFVRTLCSLPLSEQQTIRLHYLYWTVEAIAIEQSISRDLVYQRLHRFRKAFKTKLEQSSANCDYVQVVSSRVSACELNAKLQSLMYHADCRLPGDLGSESFVRWISSSTKLTKSQQQNLIETRAQIDRVAKSVEDQEYACGLLTEWSLLLERGKINHETNSNYRKLLQEVIPEMASILAAIQKVK